MDGAAAGAEARRKLGEIEKACTDLVTVSGDDLRGALKIYLSENGERRLLRLHNAYIVLAYRNQGMGFEQDSPFVEANSAGRIRLKEPTILIYIGKRFSETRDDEVERFFVVFDEMEKRKSPKGVIRDDR